MSMSMSQRTGLWLAGAAFLASMEFGFAHLQQVGFWPLQLIVSSLWRVAGPQVGAADGASVWAPPAALFLTGLLTELLALWNSRRSRSPGWETAAWRERSEGDDHE